jgi:hypothetical protein
MEDNIQLSVVKGKRFKIFFSGRCYSMELKGNIARLRGPSDGFRG